MLQSCGYDGNLMMNVPQYQCTICKSWEFILNLFLFMDVYLIAAQYLLFSPPSLECISDMFLYILRWVYEFLWFMPKLYVIWSLFTLNFVNYYRVIQLDWSIGFWWVLLSSFQELSFILLMVWTECSIYANYLLSPCFLMLFPNAAIPLNKQLYTFSYVCVTSGAAALVFSALYIMVCFFFPHEISFFFFHINWVIIDLLAY